VKTASWIVLAVAGALTLLASLASLGVAYFASGDQIGPAKLEELTAGRPAVATAVRARRATAASYGAGFAVLFLAITLGPYRRGDVWGWWAILAGILTEALLSALRVPILDTWSGAAPALIQLAVVGVGLALGAGRLGAAKPPASTPA
jgi:hypothetical protein